MRVFLLVGDYAGGMGYPDGGGLTPAARAKREQVRMQAGELFAAGVAPAQVARRLRVSRTSVYAWLRAWQAGGLEALRSKGANGSPCRLDERHPTAGWVIQAIRNLVMDLEDANFRARFLIRDRDGKFPALMDEILADAGIQTVLTGIRMPQMNSIMERWVQSCRHELLDRCLL
ncbi:helix-turn-helix domain-containing protein [Nonomuraea sp. NPDC003707]